MGGDIDRDKLEDIAKTTSAILQVYSKARDEKHDFYRLNLNRNEIDVEFKTGVMEIKDSDSITTAKEAIKEGFELNTNPEGEKSRSRDINDISVEEYVQLVTLYVYSGLLSHLPDDFENFKTEIEIYFDHPKKGLKIEILQGNKKYKINYSSQELFDLTEEVKHDFAISDYVDAQKWIEKELVDVEKLCNNRLSSITPDEKTKWDEIQEMDGIEFENFLRNLFDSMGYEAEITSASNDQGADLILERRTKKIVVQAKRYSGNVSNSAVQETVGAINHYNAERGIVVTTGGFTESAKELAESNNVDLWEGSKVKSKIEKYLEK